MAVRVPHKSDRNSVPHSDLALCPDCSRVYMYMHKLREPRVKFFCAHESLHRLLPMVLSECTTPGIASKQLRTQWPMGII